MYCTVAFQVESLLRCSCLAYINICGDLGQIKITELNPMYTEMQQKAKGTHT